MVRLYRELLTHDVKLEIESEKMTQQIQFTFSKGSDHLHFIHSLEYVHNNNDKLVEALMANLRSFLAYHEWRLCESFEAARNTFVVNVTRDNQPL